MRVNVIVIGPKKTGRVACLSSAHAVTLCLLVRPALAAQCSLLLGVLSTRSGYVTTM
jgi:hypothetical protein